MGCISYEYPQIKRKCVLCKKRFYYSDLVDIQKDIQQIQNFNICKNCLKQLNIMLSRLNSGLIGE